MSKRTKSTAVTTPHVAIREQEWDALMRAIAMGINGGSLAGACRSVFGDRHHYSAIHRAIHNDPRLVVRLADAQSEFGDALVAEAFRRGVAGVPEPVFYQGAKVGTVTRYSDALLQSLLRNRIPQWLDGRKAGDVTVHHDGEVEPRRALSISLDEYEMLPANLQRSMVEIAKALKAIRAVPIEASPLAEVEHVESDPYDMRELESIL